MSMKAGNFVPVVDLFAGPGGLGEGFSSVEEDAFRIIVSAEMDPHAHRTLQLRAFYRALFRGGNENALDAYYSFCNGADTVPETPATRAAWAEAELEARQLTLGNPEHNDILDAEIRRAKLSADVPWVLIGGPPCQAYSLVGRSRNLGKADYRPEEDHRHFLYREYLRIIREHRPTVFVMENVKGILSSSVEGEHIFHSILKDLAAPGGEAAYRIHSLSHDVFFESGMDLEDIDVKKFIVRSEEYGIPQARHRVILLGVRKDIDRRLVQPISRALGAPTTVQEALTGLPDLRSTLSLRGSDGSKVDSPEAWADVVRGHFTELARAAKQRKWTDLSNAFKEYATLVRSDMSAGSLRLPIGRRTRLPQTAMRRWYHDPHLKVWLNHEARAHMSSDLMRYAYAASFATLEGRSPKGHAEFDLLDKLRPLHANWESGKFSDRFRVQLADEPATTVTSHISKDGHYFIHPDPLQCRSLTVREAARLQTFPDNYFFQGNRTQQFHQVGNAVPPLLAHQIAKAVKRILIGTTRKEMDESLIDEAA